MVVLTFLVGISEDSGYFRLRIKGCVNIQIMFSLNDLLPSLIDLIFAHVELSSAFQMESMTLSIRNANIGANVRSQRNSNII